jgi:GNAT superfamily N-acetyltransferase
MIRRANRRDLPLIASLIRELAEFEHLSHQVSFEERDLANDLFGRRAIAQVLIAQEGSGAAAVPVGFALFFHNYSTFLGRPGIYIEDVFVRPAFRGRGHGKALLSYIAALACQSGCGRVEWSVLDWNSPAKGFYEKLAAVPLSDWTTYRLTDEPLYRLAQAQADAAKPSAKVPAKIPAAPAKPAKIPRD